MTDTEKMFFTCLGDFLSRNKTTVAEEIDFPLLVRYAKMQEVSGIIHYQLKPAVNDEALSRGYLRSLYDYKNRVHLLSEISDALDGAGIRFIIFKGPAVAKYYPVPELRSMSDCDILVRKSDKQKAADVLCSLGFTTDKAYDAEWSFTKNSLHFELHHALLYDETVNTKKDKEFCKKVWEYALPSAESPSKYEITPEYHLVFLLLHLKKHMLNKGVGFRQFADISLFYKNAPINAEKLDLLLKETGLERFFKVCLELCDRWFYGAADSTVFDDAFYNTVTESVFAGGVFGSFSTNVQRDKMLNNVRKRGKLMTVVGNIFPTYANMRFVPYYSFLNGRPYLLPAAWIYRLYRAVKYRKLSSSKESARRVMNSEKELADRESFLKIWGI